MLLIIQMKRMELMGKSVSAKAVVTQSTSKTSSSRKKNDFVRRYAQRGKYLYVK